MRRCQETCQQRRQGMGFQQGIAGQPHHHAGLAEIKQRAAEGQIEKKQQQETGQQRL